jgi:hypothetical protein
MEKLRQLSEVAKAIMESDAKYEQDFCKMNVLFPLLETLGYDATKAGDIILNPAYINNGQYKIDYGLRGENEETVKTMIKMIEFNAEPGLEFSNIRQCIMPGDRVEYIMITDCFNYYVYANAEEGMTFIDVVSFNLAEVKPSDKRSLELLKNPSCIYRQDYALNNEEEPEEIETETKPVKNYIPPVKTVKKVANDVVFPIIIGSICAIIILSAVIFGFMERNNIENWYNVHFNHDEVGLNYYSLKGNVEIETYQNKLNTVKVSITNTNLPANANVTLILKSSNNEQSMNKDVRTGSDGCIVTDVTIPETWKNSTITVTASLLFNAYQTAEVTEKYGQYGQMIVSLEGDKLSIGNNSVYYDHDAIDAYIKNEQAMKDAAELEAIRNYFSQYTIVKYSNGDLCFYPKGYNTDDWETANDNITSTNKSYAKIYWSAATQTGTFYYVVGTFMNSASWPAGVFMLSDTVNSYNLSIKNGHFKYHMNKYSSVTGWCQFDPTGVNSLIPILSQIYSSGSATIEFKDITKIAISQDDKNAVLGIIDLYTKYFSTGQVLIKDEWLTR